MSIEQPDYQGPARRWTKIDAKVLSFRQYVEFCRQVRWWQRLVGTGLYVNPALQELATVRMGERIWTKARLLWLGPVVFVLYYWRERGDPKWFAREHEE